MKFRRLRVLGIVITLITCLAACDESASYENENVEKTITFTANVVGAKAEALKEACREFEKETGYTVDFQTPGARYEELMKIKMSAKELPDVFTTHGWSVGRYSDYLMPVNDLEWAKDIDEKMKPIITDYEGKMFVLPVDNEIAGIIYNASVLEEAGVNPDEIKTWDDFTESCNTVKKAGKNPIHIGAKDYWTVGQLFNWIALSYYITDKENSQIKALREGKFNTALWEKVAGLVDKWRKSGYINEDVLTADYHSDIEAMAAGDTAFCFFGNSSIVDVKSINPDARIGMMPVPAANEGDEPGLIAGEDIAVGVWKDSKVKEEAIELLNYLAKPEVAKKIAEAAGNRSGLTTVEVEIGEIEKYLEKYKDIETFPYFDRAYLPGGMWDVMCATGIDILAQKEGAVKNAAETMEDNFNDKYTQ